VRTKIETPNCADRAVSKKIQTRFNSAPFALALWGGGGAGRPSQPEGEPRLSTRSHNASLDAAGRRVDWIHVSDTGQRSMKPSRRRHGSAKGARTYMGAIHKHGTLRLRGFAGARRKLLPELGRAAYGGFGRTRQRDARISPEQSAA